MGPDLYTSNFLMDAIRSIFSVLDMVAFWALELAYRLFFQVISVDIISSAVVSQFYSRVQLILGFFVLFQLALTILKGIVDPDAFTNAKTGAGNVIAKIFVSLMILTLLVPINFASPKNEYEQKLKENGVLFGTLYSLQKRILDNNTIGRLIFGTKANSYTSNVSDASRVFASNIIKTFYQINLVDERNRTHVEGHDDAEIVANRVCQNYNYNGYISGNVSAGDVYGLATAKCGLLSSNYAYSYTPILSTIAGFVFAAIFLSFSVDVIVRTAKLAILRLIAPIPVISYMNPMGSKDTAFNAWVKLLTSTFLDLFIRLATIYAVLFIIGSILSDSTFFNSLGSVGLPGKIVVFVGLLVFAKQAPKFFKEALGLKGDDSGSLFGGLAAAVGVAGIGAGAVGGAIANGMASYQNASKKNAGAVAKAALAGSVGFVGGGVNAGRAYMTAKGNDSGAVWSKVRAYNDKAYANAADKSSFFGRTVAAAAANLGFRNEYQQMETKIKYYEAAGDAMDRIGKAFDGNGVYKLTIDTEMSKKVKKAFDDRGWKVDKYIDSVTGDIRDKDGNVILKIGKEMTLKDLNDISSRVQATGDQRLITAVDEAKKYAQGERLAFLLKYGTDRDKVVALVKDGKNGWSSNDLTVYDAAKTIYDVSQAYSTEPEFKDKFHDKAFDEKLQWGGDFKWSAGKAKDSANALKNSNEYAKAKANAQRAAESQKK